VFNYDRSLLLGSCVEVACCDVIYFPLHPVNNYDRSLLLGSCVEVACCDVIYFPLHPVNRKLLLHGAPFLWCM